jgi:hypothetical protein
MTSSVYRWILVTEVVVRSLPVIALIKFLCNHLNYESEADTQDHPREAPP